MASKQSIDFLRVKKSFDGAKNLSMTFRDTFHYVKYILVMKLIDFSSSNLSRGGIWADEKRTKGAEGGQRT